MSTQPNRKQQRLARELAKRDGISYQAALAQVRTGAQKPDKSAVTEPHYKLLAGLYDEAFAPTGKWPLFQYISQLWDDSQVEARDVYLDLAEQGLVRPAMARTHQFQLGENTVVGVSLRGLIRLPTASVDLDCFVGAVRYVGERAADFRPVSATELGRLSITSEQVRDHLGIQPGDPMSRRLGTLISDEAWQLWTSFGSTETGTWSMEVNLERARRYRDINTVAEFLAISYPAAAPLPTAPTPATVESIDAGLPDPGQSRAFISYSHQDEAFVSALVQRLKGHGIGVWIDRVDLLIGDSLIRRIGDAIHEGDFVIAVISRHSVNSSWCEKELTLAVTQGIQSKQVKVLPVRLDGVALPNFLADTLWVEADRSDCTAVAAALANAVKRHLERRWLDAGAIKTDSSAASEEPVDSQNDHSESGSAQETDFPIEHDIPIDRFDVVQAPIPPIGWAENKVFRVGYPLDWYDTTPTEPTIEGKPALVVLRRDDRTGLPSDPESRGVIRCFSHGRGTSSEFFAAASKLDHLRARALRARLIEPLQFVRAGGAPCYTFRVDGTIRIRAFQARPSAITEVHLFHNGEWLLMQLESDPKFHADYQQALATVLGTLTWK